MKQSSGLTLIEVLIALAIVSIALTAVIKAAGQDIRATHYLQEKTVALWVGTQVLNEVRVGVLKLSDPGDKLKQSTTMLGKTWYFEANQEETPNKRIKKISVDVFLNESDVDEQISPIVSLESYKYDDRAG